MNIIKNGGTFKLNCISYLNAWVSLADQAAGINNMNLEIVFKQVNHVEFSYRQEIKSRDYENIIAECAEATKKFAVRMSDELINCMNHGYIK